MAEPYASDDDIIAAPVFLDRTGRRWPRVRRVLTGLGIISTVLFLLFVASFLVPPLLPQFRPVEAGRVVPRFPGTRQARIRRARREQLYAALAVQRTGREIRRAAKAIERGLTGAQASRPRQIRVGFYVPWADNSRDSFAQHAGSLDWVVCEWGYIDSTGTGAQIRPDTGFFGVYDSIPARPRVLEMISNLNRQTQRFDGRAVRRMVSRAANRRAVIAALVNTAVRYRLGGVTVDFEEVPRGTMPGLLRFLAELHAQLAPRHLLLTQALAVSTDPGDLRRLAAASDYVFLMLYDEHYGQGPPGPVASQAWYVQQARNLLRSVPRAKAILALGAYGYDWNDAGYSGETYTFQEVLAKGRDHPGSSRMEFDRASLNPYMTWTDADSTDHLVWYLDAASAYNQVVAGRRLGAAGYAVWRLGAEDPAFWRVVAAGNVVAAAEAFSTIPPGYETEFIGKGEILQVVASPRSGSRIATIDTTAGLFTGERIVNYPSPYIIRKYGAVPHHVALTFDDGPDGRWTPEILDTLASRHATATFFVIGQNVETHIPLVRRMVAAGNLVGNHTFTHPNLAITPDWLTRLELDANQRLLEAILNRRSFFFRPPYFGDAEPTTLDELVPVDIASRRGYVTVGLHIDAEDWHPISATQIIANVLDQRYYGGRQTGRTGGNVILLHDGGGNRAQTVAALGPLIDSLRAHGDTIVPLSRLAGITRAEAMPPLPARSAFTRMVELATFAVVSALEWTFYWLFLAAVVLGALRLGMIIVLAAFQRYRRRRPAMAYTPPVSVIVPAYNEERVIASTLRSLVAQTYPGELEIIVVDDGSPDATYDLVLREFGDHPSIQVFRKGNGGKASALNFGIARARGEIVVCLDADTQFTPVTVERLVAPLADLRVAAVAGNAKVGNRHNLVTRWQALEYVTSQNLDRRALAVLNAITIVPGAVGAWRRSYVQAVGGFSDDTLAEDQDLTWSLGEEGACVSYADDAVAYTEAPDTLRTLVRQRFRWSFGTLQCAWKHRRILFRPRYGALGMIALPNVWLFQIFYTAISPIADLLFAWSLVSVFLARVQHGSTYALTDLRQVLFLYAIFLAVDWLAAVIAFWMEPGEERALTWLILIQRFVFRQAMYWVVVRSLGAAIRGHVVGWGKLERKGMHLLPTTAQTPAPRAPGQATGAA